MLGHEVDTFLPLDKQIKIKTKAAVINQQLYSIMDSVLLTSETSRSDRGYKYYYFFINVILTMHGVEIL